MIEDINLSEHFKLSEMTRTSFGDLQELNRKVTDEEIAKMKILCEDFLEPIRRQFRLPIIVHSGFRGKALNERVNGSATSQHTFAEAVDFHVKGLDDLEGSTAVFRWIHFDSGLKYGQVIHEVRRATSHESIWIHLSLGRPYRHKSLCGQVLTYRNGLYTFLRQAQGQ